MVFCDIAMAEQIERAACRLSAEVCAHAALRVDRVLAEPICGGFAAFVEPGYPVNKVAGLGFAGGFDEAAWEALEHAYAQRGASVEVELATLADPSIATWLTRRGYELVGVENVLGLGLPVPAGASPPGVQVVVSGPDELDAWMELVYAGFATPDVQGVPAQEHFERTVIDGYVRDLVQVDGLVRCVALRNGEPAGGGTVRMCGGLAQLCGASTLPAHRRRGVQSAILAFRLSLAGSNGCSMAVVTTQPGSKSQQNMQRQGFELLYARNVLRHA